MSAADAARVSYRAWDNVHRSAATACRQRVIRPGRGRGLREQSIELVELHLCAIVVSKSRRPFHLTDDRIKGAVGMLRRAEVAKARVRFG